MEVKEQQGLVVIALILEIDSNNRVVAQLFYHFERSEPPRTMDTLQEAYGLSFERALHLISYAKQGLALALEGRLTYRHQSVVYHGDVIDPTINVDGSSYQALLAEITSLMMTGRLPQWEAPEVDTLDDDYDYRQGQWAIPKWVQFIEAFTSCDYQNFVASKRVDEILRLNGYECPPPFQRSNRLLSGVEVLVRLKAIKPRLIVRVPV